MPSFPSKMPIPAAIRPAILAACAVFALAGCLRQSVEPDPDKGALELSYGAATDVEGSGVSAFKYEINDSKTLVSGDLDWAYYGYRGVTDVIRKSTGNSQIKKDNIGQVVDYFPPIAPYVKIFNWTGGTPVATAETNNGIRADRLNEGFNVRMPAGTVARMATLYVSTVNAQGRLTVDIPGGEVEPAVILVDSKGSTYGYRSFIFKVYFRAKSPKEVSLKWIKTEDYNVGKGTVVLHGAGFNTFNDIPPDLSIGNVVTPGYTDIAIAGKSHYIEIAIAKQDEGVRHMQLYRDGAYVATVNGFTGFPQMFMYSPRKAQYDILVTDKLGNRKWSNSKTYYLWTEHWDDSQVNIPDANVEGIATRFVHDQYWVGDVRLWVNVTHPQVSDLKISLVSPSGGRWTVLDRMGQGQNIVDLVLGEGFIDDVSLASAPFSGRFKPYSVNPPIIPQPARGTWYVTFQDLAGRNVGTKGKIRLCMRDP